MDLSGPGIDVKLKERKKERKKEEREYSDPNSLPSEEKWQIFLKKN
jgi:hypothetical protein